MARTLKNSRVNPQAIDPLVAHERAVARAEDEARDNKVDQIHDQPGRGRRPSRRTTRRVRKF